MTTPTESDARAEGRIVYRAHNGQQAWCLCPDCSAHHARNTRRTKHDRWALSGQDWRIRRALANPAN